MCTNESSGQLPDKDIALVKDLHQSAEQILTQIGLRIIGQRDLIEHLLVTMLAHGHALLVGVPGLAKTLLINTLADVMDLAFNRIQFTPDLMPSDITGSDILDTTTDGQRAFKFVKGPIFCNLLLADEINRTPPKTQAALLQSMQEQRVTSGGRTFDLTLPFHVFATQNPIEQEGTYPLPEAQLDRFLMMLNVCYPSESEEISIVKRTTSSEDAPVAKVISPDQILSFQALVRRVPIADTLVNYAVNIVRSTRPAEDETLPVIKEYVVYGSGPRATQHLVLAAKARAILQGRTVVDVDDIKTLASPVLRHRIITNFKAEANKIQPNDLIAQILEQRVR